jgi:hypothetical protein
MSDEFLYQMLTADPNPPGGLEWIWCYMDSTSFNHLLDSNNLCTSTTKLFMESYHSLWHWGDVIGSK